MSKLFLLLFVSISAHSQSAQLAGPISPNEPALVQAANAALKAGFHGVTTNAKQSFTVRVDGIVLGTFLSLGGRSSGDSYQCLQSFIPASANANPSLVVTAGADKLGASICDYPRAVGILRSAPNQIRVGILYANSVYLEGDVNAGTEAPPVSVAVAIDPKTCIMTLDTSSTAILQRAAPSSLQAMRKLF